VKPRTVHVDALAEQADFKIEAALGHVDKAEAADQLTETGRAEFRAELCYVRTLLIQARDCALRASAKHDEPKLERQPN
jgi:hypothetical protein